MGTVLISLRVWLGRRFKVLNIIVATNVGREE